LKLLEHLKGLWAILWAIFEIYDQVGDFFIRWATLKIFWAIHGDFESSRAILGDLVVGRLGATQAPSLGDSARSASGNTGSDWPTGPRTEIIQVKKFRSDYTQESC